MDSGKRPWKATLRAARVLRRESLRAQRVHVRDGAGDVRPHLREEGGVARVAEIVGDRVDELAVTVVLGNGIGAARVDAARHLSVRELIGRVPLEKGAHLFGMAEPKECGADHRAVADPRARVGARAGVDLRTVIVDEDVGELRAQRLGDARGGAGKRDRHAVERRVPRARHFRRAPVRERARVGIAREGTRAAPCSCIGMST